MTTRRSSPDLGPNLETALSTFPFSERDWESDARAIEARLSESLRGSTEGSLLTAPLPIEPGEGTLPSATATPVTNSGVRTQSLTELARRSVEKRQQGERDLLRETLAIAARQRPVGTEVRVLGNTTPAAAPPPAASNSASGAATRGASGVARQTTDGRERQWAKLALGLPVLALAAAAVLWLRQATPVSSRPQQLPVAVAESASKSEQVNAAPVVTNAAPARGVDPLTLPRELASEAAAPVGVGEAAQAKVAAAGATAVPAARAAAPAKPNSDNLTPQEERAAPLARTAPSAEKSLPADPALRPADSGGDLPVKPSSGAVQAALGAVMGGARRCIAGNDSPSSAVVVFGSDGRVRDVSVTGPAAGTSSGTCIQAALSRARVQPFATTNFSVSATIRPD